MGPSVHLLTHLSDKWWYIYIGGWSLAWNQNPIEYPFSIDITKLYYMNVSVQLINERFQKIQLTNLLWLMLCTQRVLSSKSVRLITLLTAVCGTCCSAGAKNPFFAQNWTISYANHLNKWQLEGYLLALRTVAFQSFWKNSGALLWVALSWVPFQKMWKVTWAGAKQLLGQVPVGHLRKWLGRHLSK